MNTIIQKYIKRIRARIRLRTLILTYITRLHYIGEFVTRFSTEKNRLQNEVIELPEIIYTYCRNETSGWRFFKRVLLGGSSVIGVGAVGVGMVASTGLYGAASTSAFWAAAGGGSLASGGFGMVGGYWVVGVSAFVAAGISLNGLKDIDNSSGIFHKTSKYRSIINKYFEKNSKIYNSKLYGIKDINKEKGIVKGTMNAIKYGIWDCEREITDSHGNILPNYYLKYDGGFKKLRYHGYGKLYYPNGQLFIKGHFDKGFPIHIIKAYDIAGNLILSNFHM